MWIASVLVAAAAEPGTAPRARSEPACAALDEAELRTLVLDAQSAVDRGDLELTAQIVGEVDQRLPCLTFVIAPRTWADLLVTKAIVAFTEHGDWESPMAAALRIRPEIDRGVGPSHPLYAWVPPPPPPGGAPLPDGVVLYVDGQISPVLPPDEGIYLAQKADPDGRYVNTELLEDRALDPGWAGSPVERPPQVASWGRIGVSLGTASSVQDVQWTSDVYPDREPTGVAAGVSGDLQVTFFSPFGVLAHGYAGWFDAPVVDGRVAAIWSSRKWTLGGGLGRATTPVAQWVYDTQGATPRVLERRVQQLQYGHVTGLFRSRGDLGYDVGATLGLGSAASLGELTFGLVLPEIGGQRYRFGVWVDRRDGQFVQQGAADRKLLTSSATLSLSFEMVRGEY